MKGALAIVQKITRTDPVAAAERELAAVITELEANKAEAQRLHTAWLFAASQAEAEQIRRQAAECERIVERCEIQLPEMQARLAAAKADRERETLARHRSTIFALYPKLRRAIEEAARLQAETIAARDRAIRELGEHVVNLAIPHLAFRGLLLPDLVALWTAEADRLFAAKPSTPVVQPLPPRAVAAPPQRPAAPTADTTPPQRPVRTPRRDPPAGDGQRQVVLLRAGVELVDGSRGAIGDVITLPADQAGPLVLSGAADFAAEQEAEKNG